MVEEEEREEGEVAVAVVVVEEEQEQQEEQELPPPAKKGRQRKTRPVAGINLASGGVKTRRQTEELEKTAKQLAIVAAAAKKPEEGAVETMVCDMEEGMALEDEPAMGEREEGEVEVEDGEDVEMTSQHQTEEDYSNENDMEMDDATHTPAERLKQLGQLKPKKTTQMSINTFAVNSPTSQAMGAGQSKWSQAEMPGQN
ncbi:hypothetical protein BDF19DRAFT_437763 [Syncephalis fuscata]|nr:hypothetical protein BDF19DRAFT_437763 [Syncephalis fuscata]